MSLESSTIAVPEQVDVPRHVAVIMDGNGRWARQRGLPRVAGHRRGVQSVRAVVKTCGELGVKWLTLFAFSSENWRRPEQEVGVLMGLLTSALETEVAKLHRNGIRLRMIGDLSRFTPRMRQLIEESEALTENNATMNLNVAVNYGGRWDILTAARELASQAVRGELDPDSITEVDLSSRLSTGSAPEPDLFIRTGGEKRISNFMMWQLAYTELYFTDTLWPDFDKNALLAGIESFAARQRRFGRTGEQTELTRIADGN